jgi:hypothetical protein
MANGRRQAVREVHQADRRSARESAAGTSARPPNGAGTATPRPKLTVEG